MTLRQRITALMAHGGFDPVLVSAVLDIDLSVVEHVLTDPAYTPAEPGGGAPVVRRFPFAFDTPDILAGAAIYTPTTGDVLLDAWFEISTAWDQPARADITFSDFSGFPYGLFNSVFSPIDMTVADLAWGSNVLLGQQMSTLVASDTLSDAAGVFRVPAIASVPSSPLILTSSGPTYARVAPSKFTGAGPLRLAVSQDGRAGGVNPAATVGEAVLYLVTATPT